MKSKYNTNLAAEFYVLSMLHRLGAEATLTLGNRKAVDIVIVREGGDAVTVDVKGLAGTTEWPVDNVETGAPRKDHYLVFVSFLNHIDNPQVVPEVYVIPSTAVGPFVITADSGRKFVRLGRLRKEAQDYKDAWEQLT